MVWSGDHHRIDILSGDEFAKVLVAGAALEVFISFDGVELIDRFAAVFPACCIDIGNRKNLGIGVIQKIIQQAPTLSAYSNKTHGDAIIRPFLAESQGARGKEEGCNQRGCRGRFEKLASGEFHLLVNG